MGFIFPGLSALLSAKSLHHTKYHSLGLSLRYVCPSKASSCTRPALELEQTVTLVFAPNVDKDNESKATMTWSLRSLFGIGLMSTCPLADSSKVFFDYKGGAIDLKPAGIQVK